MSSKTTPRRFWSIFSYFLICVFIVDQSVQASNSNGIVDNTYLQKKLQQKLKSQKHSGRSSKSCENIKHLYPKVKKEYFILTGVPNEPKSQSEDPTYTLSSIEPINTLLENCKQETKNYIELTWRYEFFESMHCLKVELDFGKNVTDFVRKANYNYYAFSYRELGKKNKYLQRQPINESVNTLTVKGVNHKPYIICVTFYKYDYFAYLNSNLNITGNMTQDANSTNSTTPNEPSCSDYQNFYAMDKQTHDVDLCVDIDTHAHFLNDIEHEGKKSEFIVVAFIIFFILGILIVISVSHYIIQNIKLKKYSTLFNRFHIHRSHASGSKAEITPLMIGGKQASGPTITVTDFSSNCSINSSESKGSVPHNMHHGNLQTQIHAHAISHDSKLSNSHESSEHERLHTLGAPGGGSHDNFGKCVKFHINDDMIVEENEEKLDAIENNEEQAIKTISHLLDDKPWSRSNSIFGSLQPPTPSNINEHP